jgi:hypothetical protein
MFLTSIITLSVIAAQDAAAVALTPRTTFCKFKVFCAVVPLHVIAHDDEDPPARTNCLPVLASPKHFYSHFLCFHPNLINSDNLFHLCQATTLNPQPLPSPTSGTPTVFRAQPLSSHPHSRRLRHASRHAGLPFRLNTRRSGPETNSVPRSPPAR